MQHHLVYNLLVCMADSQMSVRSKELRRIWDQKRIPVVLRRTGLGEKVRLRLPKQDDDHIWLRNGRRPDPKWNKLERCWEIPKKWFTDFVNRALDRYGNLYIIQPYVETEICASACQNATGHDCQCSCMGANHGAGNDGSWFEVSEAFSVRSSKPFLACRLLHRKMTHIKNREHT